MNVGCGMVEGTHLVTARGSRGLRRAWEGLGGDLEWRGWTRTISGTCA